MNPLRALVATSMLAVLPGFGCSRPAQTEVRIGPPAQATSEASGEEAAESEEAAHAAGTGCSWIGVDIAPREDQIALCFSVDGACFAATSHFNGRVKVSFPEGRPSETGAQIEIEDGGATISAWTAGESFLLYPQRPLVMSAAFIPAGGEGVFVERVHRGGVELGFRGQDAFRPRAKPLRAEAACSDLGMTWGCWVEELSLSAAGLLGSAHSERLLALDQPVGVATTPGGAPIVELSRNEEGFTYVDFFEQRGQWSLVYWSSPARDGVFGWVSTSLLADPQGPNDAQLIGLIGMGKQSTATLPKALVCPAETELFAEVAGLRSAIGTIPANAAFGVPRKSQSEYTEIRLGSDQIDLLGDARWLVKTASLENCSPR
ncbi:MAG: hypothetical protein U0441_17370 [Polyangiaceae bacterium]